MKLTDTLADKVIAVLTNARTNPAVRIMFGTRQRWGLSEGIKTGDFDQKHRRYIWLGETRDKLIEALAAHAKAYNEKHPHDAITIADLIDVAVNVLNALKAAEAS